MKGKCFFRYFPFCVKIVMKKSPAFAYAINRNPLLRLFGLLPKRIQFKAIELVLK